VLAAALALVLAAPKVMTMDDCVRVAIGDGNGQVAEAKGKVREWEGRLREVESTYFPKLLGLTYLAPMYGVDNVRQVSPQAPPDAYTYDLNKWGPYFKLQAILVEPICTFGRYDAGKEAATERAQVEHARVEQTKNYIALQTRQFYLLHIYARSFRPALDLANRLVVEALDKATEEFNSGSGSVTQVDLNKLKFGRIQLQQAAVQAEIGAALSLAALKHTMGLPQDADIQTADSALPPLPVDELDPLQAWVERAAEHRPEVAQLFHGIRAADAFEVSEKMSSNPTAFIAVQADVNWLPTWPNLDNPFIWNRWNISTPGAAVGLQFDVDVAKTIARAYGAHGLVQQVEGLKKFASTGIPMEVRKAYDDTVQAGLLTKLSDDESTAGKKWLVFAGASYAAGTGEAKDVLEGLVAYMTAKKAFFDSLNTYYSARATLWYASGGTGLPE
jgi:outer membrane protein TolC